MKNGLKTFENTSAEGFWHTTISFKHTIGFRNTADESSFSRIVVYILRARSESQVVH